MAQDLGSTLGQRDMHSMHHSLTTGDPLYASLPGGELLPIGLVEGVFRCLLPGFPYQLLVLALLQPWLVLFQACHFPLLVRLKSRLCPPAGLRSKPSVIESHVAICDSSQSPH